MRVTESLTHNHFQPEQLDLFWWFICERQWIWHRRVVEQQPPPWTQDPILQRERFTNVYRELDPGTQYAVQGILERDASKPDKIFNIMLYRLIGRAETHHELGFQHLSTFNSDHVERTLKRIRTAGRPPFTAAYMVSAYRSMGSTDKAENVARLFAQVHQQFDHLYDKIGKASSAAEVHSVFSAVYGFGNFLAYQILVDLLYPLAYYKGAPLLPYSPDDWASPGPGAKRGVDRLLQNDARTTGLDVMCWLRDRQEDEFARLDLNFPYLHTDRNDPVPLSLANIQNCLCEFHKYVKIKDGSGRGRRKFRPSPTANLSHQLSLVFGTNTKDGDR